MSRTYHFQTSTGQERGPLPDGEHCRSSLILANDISARGRKRSKHLKQHASMLQEHWVQPRIVQPRPTTKQKHHNRVKRTL